MKNKKISFKNEVLMPIVAIFLVSILIISLIHYRLLDLSVKTKTDANLELFINSVMAQINHLNLILAGAEETLNEKHIAIGRTIVYILDNTPYNMTPLALQDLAESLDMIEINIVNTNGILTHSNIPGHIGFDYNSVETTSIYMALADGTLTELSEEPRMSISGGDIYGGINHYTGIARSNGRGFIQIGFNADVIARLQEGINIERTIRESNILRNGYGKVMSDGIIIAHPDENISGTDVSGEEWFKAINSGKGFAWITIAGQKYYAGFNNTNGYTVLALVPESEYYVELNLIMAQTVLFMIISMFLIIHVVDITLGKLLQPIEYLVQGLEEIASGNLDTRIEGSYNNEFDKIKDAVNSMAENIKTRETVISGIEYASKIQRKLLPQDDVFKEAFADYHCIWKPKDIVGGDIYWIKNFHAGTVLCVCDCTGHGTPGALLTMLVASAFDTIVTEENCFDTAEIIWELEKRLVDELNVNSHNDARLIIHDGCDLAVLFIGKDGFVRFSSGNTNVFISNGSKVMRYKGQHLRIGEGRLRGKEEVHITTIPYVPCNKFYISSDGLYTQIGSKDAMPFGYEEFEKIILREHEKPQSVIAQKIWETFESYRGEQAMRDDFQLIAFTPRCNTQYNEDI